MDVQSTRQIRRAREQFLSDGKIGPDLARFVRPDILQSWRRSRLSGASMGVDVLPFQAEAHGDSALCQAAEPVLSRLAEQLSGLAAGVLLSDRNARILRRWAPATSILPKMDRIQADSGTSGSQELARTASRTWWSAPSTLPRCSSPSRASAPPSSIRSAAGSKAWSP